MQIHELKTLAGVPGGTDYIPIDTGFVTAKISAPDLLKPVKDLADQKINNPKDDNNQLDNGTAGQLLRTNGDGSTVWVNEGLPTDEQTAQAISDWLDDHPEATTTVMDGSLTETKFSEALKLKTIKDYVTPEMFGAVGDGVTDDVDALDAAVASGKVILLTQHYYISRAINIVSNTRIYGDRVNRRYDAPSDTNYIRTDGSAFFHSDNTVAMIQLLDIALWNSSTSPNVVFDCRVDRSDFRLYGYNIDTFSNQLQACNFDYCNLLNCKGTFSSNISDSDIINCYVSGNSSNENAFLTGLISALNVRGCYFDFWHIVFNPSYSYNNMVNSNIFDACYHVFVGEYHEFGIINNVFMRIKDSELWTLNKTDWCVLCNGLRNRTRVIGNRVDADYFIHTTLTGLSYPNTNSYSGFNSLYPGTQIVWNPYPNDNSDLLNTRVEDINYKTYAALPNASLTDGADERFNHQIINVDGELYLNNNGNWKSISLSEEKTLTFSAQTIPANSCVNLYDNDAANKWLAARYYLTKPAFAIPATVTFCAYCHTDGVFRIIVSNPSGSAISFPASTWKIKSFRL